MSTVMTVLYVRLPVSVCVLLLVTSCRSCEDGLMYRGQCEDVYSPVCPRGNRLFSGERGVYCDCDTPQGWLRHRGECHQDLTPVPALCGQHKIIQVSSDNGRQSYSCIDNPCGHNQLPHRQHTSWPAGSGLTL